MTTFDPLNDKIGVYSEQLGEIAETNSYAMVLRTLMSGGIVTLTPNQASGQMIIDAPNNYFTTITTDNLTMSGNGTAAAPLVSLMPPIVISPASISAGTIETAYHVAFAATGGSGSGYTFSIAAGTLPAGMALSSAGDLNGTPLQFGTYHFTVRATDGWGITGEVDYTLSLASITLTVNPTNLPPAYYNSSYTTNLTTPNGTGGDKFTITSGTLPSGLSLNIGGVISGTPTAIGTWTFVVSVVDSAGDTGTVGYTMHVINNLSVTPATLAAGSIGVAYSQTLTAAGGSGSGFVFSRASGLLPSGLSLSSSGVISGSPTAAGTSTFTIQIADSANNLKNFPFSITVNLVTLTLTPGTLPAGAIGYAYGAHLYGVGGLGSNYSYSVSGALPPGLTMSGGVISGTITGTGLYTFTVYVSDTAGDTGAAVYSINVPAVPGGNAIWDGAPGLDGAWPVGIYTRDSTSATWGVPQHNWLIIEVWGGGGGGGSSGIQHGADGGASACDYGGTAYGGQGGGGARTGGGFGAGGGATGGNALNLAGGNEVGNAGGNAPSDNSGTWITGFTGGGGAYGGAFGAYPIGDVGGTPGGGGGAWASGGGAGGYCKSTYSAGSIPPGTIINLIAGGGGDGGDAGTTWQNGTGGGPGRVVICWG